MNKLEVTIVWLDKVIELLSLLVENSSTNKSPIEKESAINLYIPEEHKDLEKENYLHYKKVDDFNLLSEKELKKQLIYMLDFAKFNLKLNKNDLMNKLWMAQSLLNYNINKAKKKTLVIFMRRLQNIILIYVTTQ